MQKQITIQSEKTLETRDILKAFFELTLNNQITFDIRTKEEFDFTDELKIILSFCDSYNEYNKWDTLQALKEIDQVLPRAEYKEGNPNNGNRNYSLTVGRESSPVIYITRRTLKDFSEKILTNEQIDRIKKIIRDTAKADEISFNISKCETFGTTTEQFRFWWD